MKLNKEINSEKIKKLTKQRQQDTYNLLTQLVRARTISANAKYNQEITNLAHEIAEHCSNLGFTTEVKTVTRENQTKSNPFIIARRIVDEAYPTVLLYAHFDVQPLGNLDKWGSDPFQTQLKEGRIYGRGTADDKGAIACHLQAISIVDELVNSNYAEDRSKDQHSTSATSSKKLPLNLILFFESEEEIGSPNFEEFLKQNCDQLQSDVIIVLDSGNADSQTPGITTSLRGVATLDLKVKVLANSVHSGSYGGPILDAATTAALLISKLYHGDGSLKDFYSNNSDVQIVTPNESDQADSFFDDDRFYQLDEEEFKHQAGCVQDYKLAGTGSLSRRLWYSRALSIIGSDLTRVQEASNSIIPECTFRLSLRIAPNENPGLVASSLRDFLQGHAPQNSNVSVDLIETGFGYQADTSSNYFHLMKTSLEESWGKPPINLGQGGSIPFISYFSKTFPESQVLITAIQDELSYPHSENESVAVEILEKTITSEVLFLLKVGAEGKNSS